MLKKSLPICLLCALLVAVVGMTLISADRSVLAQDSHPLVGLWRGKWITTVPNPNSKAKGRAEENFALEVKWDSKTLTGTFNPGRFGIPVQVITLNPADGSVHVEVDIPEGHVVADGKLEDGESGARTLTGAWTQGVEKGEFKLAHD